MMQRYLALSSVRELVDELAHKGYRTKIQARSGGLHRGGRVFRRGTLFRLLQNPIYRGKIVHKGQIYVGEHPAIFEETLWDAVPSTLADRATGPSRREGVHISLLTGSSSVAPIVP